MTSFCSFLHENAPQTDPIPPKTRWSVLLGVCNQTSKCLFLNAWFSEGIHRVLGTVEQPAFRKEIPLQGPYSEIYQCFSTYWNALNFLSASFNIVTSKCYWNQNTLFLSSKFQNLERTFEIICQIIWDNDRSFAYL